MCWPTNPPVREDSFTITASTRSLLIMGWKVTSRRPNPSFSMGQGDLLPMSVFSAKSWNPEHIPSTKEPSRAIFLISRPISIFTLSDSMILPPGMIRPSKTWCAGLPWTIPFSFTRWVGNPPKFSNTGSAPLTYKKPIFMCFYLGVRCLINILFKDPGESKQPLIRIQ